MLKTEIKNEFLKLSGVAAAIKGTIDTESGIVDKILTESLYDNTIGSPPREILMNSIDAMFQAGRGGEPVTIKFPNELDNDFYIKDNGVGLTSDEVKYLFQTLGASKKRRTGENGEMAMKHLTGEFGLGSKAFFAYTDAGWVIAAKDGIQETFFLSYDGDGNRVCIPVENSRVAAPSDWQSGVCVGYAIKPSDFGRFYSEVNEVLRWVDYPVQVLGYEQEISKPTALNKGNGWATYSTQEVRQHYVRMGRIVYPLNTHRLGELKLSWNAVLHNVHLVLDVENKAVDVVASREALKYSEKTVSVLRDKLDAAVQEYALALLEQAQKAINGTWLERVQVAEFAAKNYTRLSSKTTEALVELMGLKDEERSSLLSVLHNHNEELPYWVGDGNYRYSAWSAKKREMLGFNMAPVEALDPAVGIVERPVKVYGFSMESQSTRRRTLERFRKYEIVHGRRVTTTKHGSESKTEVVSYHRLVDIVIDDASHTRERVKEAIEEGIMRTVYMITAPKGTAKSELDSYAERLSQAMGGWRIQRASDLPVPQSVIDQRQRRKLAKEQALQGLANAEALLLKWDDSVLCFKELANDMKDVLNLIYPEDQLDESGELVEVQSSLPGLPLIMPYRFGRGEVVMPGDSRETPNVLDKDFFVDGLERLYRCAAEAVGESAKYILLTTPAAIKSGKLLTSGGFKLFAEEVSNHLDYSLIVGRYQSLAQELPEMLPFETRDSFAGYYERNMAKVLIAKYYDSLSSEDDNGDDCSLRETTDSIKCKEAISMLATIAGFEQLPLLATPDVHQVLGNTAVAEVDYFHQTLQKLATLDSMNKMVNGKKLREVISKVKLPIRAKALLDQIASKANMFDRFDVFKSVANDCPVQAVRYFIAMYGVYLDSQQETLLKKVA